MDEAQDLDRTQLELALLLAAPGNDVFLVGDDDQSIYGWRLADVRRVLGLAAALPGLRRVDLETNYRCPRPVVERAVRLVEHNRERFAKRIVPGRPPTGRLVLAPDAADDLVRVTRAMRTWPDDASTRAILARTNRELLVAVVAALDLGVPFRAPDLPLPDRGRPDRRPARSGGRRRMGDASAGSPLLALGRLRRTLREEAAASGEDPATHPTSRTARRRSTWPARCSAGRRRCRTLEALRAAVDARRHRLAELRRDDAALTLATAHGTKGLEWDHVIVLADGFPGRRSICDAAEPERALEEERRLAYVAWTRARRSLTLLYDPQAPSRFLLEAFGRDELGLSAGDAAA